MVMGGSSLNFMMQPGNGSTSMSTRIIDEREMYPQNFTKIHMPVDGIIKNRRQQSNTHSSLGKKGKTIQGASGGTSSLWIGDTDKSNMNLKRNSVLV
jgi:hypothetical protein